ncbi:MAG TPA: hypothetical protein VEG34_10550 [Thermoanaerobaculia bacterium]|nr:hypothetical protein [Thermoanaerobaculia bacterium]
MLGPGRYLLGIMELALLVGFAWFGASALRARLLPTLAGAPAQLASSLLALALLIWVAELLGTSGLLKPLPYLVVTALVGVALRALSGGWHGGRGRERRPRPQAPPPVTGPAGRGLDPTALISFAIALAAVIHFCSGVKLRLSTGMTGFDSTWYHGPFAAGFFQSGNTMDLHFIAPQFLAWFYPANGEIFHAVGMLAFGRDLLSPLLNLGWFVGCLGACWCVGRPYRVAPWSLILGAVALSVPALADQAGEARNDIVGIFFLLAAVAIAVNVWAGRGEGERSLSVGALLVIGLAAGLAAGTKLNFLLPAGVLVLGLAAIAPRGGRLRALGAAGLAALAGGGYWYLRNLVHSGNPLPWIDGIGPIALPAPDQALGGREAHSVLGYLTDGTVWSDWFLPALHDGLWLFWPLLIALALAGLVLCLGRNGAARRLDPILPLAGLVGLATALAWLVAPTSASGPDGMPRGFESGLRYLAPALVLGLALLPATPPLRTALARSRARESSPPGRAIVAVLGLALLAAVAIGYPVQRHYLESRYSDPTFTTPGLDAAFKWADDVSDSRIATTSTRQYPLFGADLSNRIQFIGEKTSHGGFEAPVTCRAWREELNAGRYDYVVTTRDRLESGQPPYPEQARWTEGRGAEVILRKPPTVVFQLMDNLDPSACR